MPNMEQHNSLRILLATLASSWLLLQPAQAQTNNYPQTTDSQCNCYLTNTTTKNYFQRHKFFDFRNLDAYANVPKPIANANASSAASVTSNYFNSAAWTSTWSIMRWNNSELMSNDSDTNDATVLMVNSPNNIYIERNTDVGVPKSHTYMTMRTVRHADFQSAAEFESASVNYHYLSIRMLARTRGAAGAVTAMFTYRTAAQFADVQEADLEVRTLDPQYSIQYTNQPAYNSVGDIPGATQNVTVPSKVNWGAWQYHRMDWTPGSSSWYINGQLMSQIKFQAPRDPSQVIFNSWSDGGSWSGNMSVGSEAYMQIQWIDMVYNNTDPGVGVVPTPGFALCKSVCSIDETKTVGIPVLVNSPQNPNSGQGGQACAAAHWGQCGGKEWKGCNSCAAGTTCQKQNDYYSQCL